MRHKILIFILLVLVGATVAGVISVNSYFKSWEEASSQQTRLQNQERLELDMRLQAQVIQSMEREAYQAVLENAFRKNGMHVIVIVGGNNNVNLKITCLFFNSDWPPVIERRGLVDIWKQLGFKKVTLTDSQGYSHTWTF